ncbi:MAG: ABC transporter ATP-binding protein [Pseudomonadota bacterium]
MDDIVEIRRVSKRFGATTVLNDVSLDIRRGEFLSLLGPSGCGKTTLLRIIAGFEHPTEGQVLIDGKDVSGQPAYARNTNMIFQQLALFPHMSVIQNIGFGLRMKKIAPDIIRTKVGEMLELIQLKEFGNRMPDQLSGGQRQRVALARALVNSPDVLLLDEPLGALDLQLRLQLQIDLRRLQKALGNTFIFVTHDQTEAITMSDRIAVLNKGKIVQLGTPQEIYEAPKARFVANFVGHTNLFDGTIASIEPGGVCRVAIAGGKAVMRCESATPLEQGQQVTVALRYEKATVDVAGGPQDDSSFSGVVTDRTYMGSFLRYAVATDWGGEVTADMPVSEAARAIAEGTRVQLRWTPYNAAVLAE